jgi:enoyl-CoA hydratase/carnithine racemase
MSDRVSVSTQAGVADVRMNRADKLNALDTAMFAALIETGRSLATDSSVRAVVLSGEGRAFCAGLDVSSFAAMADRDARGPKLFDRSDESPANFAQRAAWVWTELPSTAWPSAVGFRSLWPPTSAWWRPMPGSR